MIEKNIAKFNKSCLNHNKEKKSVSCHCSSCYIQYTAILTSSNEQ
jgi:hypothetical protein